MSFYCPEDESRFSKVLLESCLILQEDLEACRRKHLAAGEEGTTNSLADLLIEEGILTPYLAEKAARKLRVYDVFCGQCRTRFTVAADKMAETKVYECTDCGYRMSRTRYQKTILGDLIIDRPQYLTDRILRKMLAKADLIDSAEVDRCVEIQKTREPRRDLARILVDESLLSLNQVRKIFRVLGKTLRKRYPYIEKMKRDIKLAKMLARRGVLPVNRVNASLVDQIRQEKETGKFVRLRDLLVESALLSPYQVKTSLPVAADQVTGLDTLVEDSDRSIFSLHPEDPSDVVKVDEGGERTVPADPSASQVNERSIKRGDEGEQVAEDSKLPVDEPIEIDKEEALGSDVEIEDLFDESDSDLFLRSGREGNSRKESGDELGEFLVGQDETENLSDTDDFSRMPTSIESGTDQATEGSEADNESETLEGRAGPGEHGRVGAGESKERGVASEGRQKGQSRRAPRRGLSEKKREEITKRLERRRGRRRR